MTPCNDSYAVYSIKYAYGFIVFYFYYNFHWICVTDESIFFRVASLALGQSYDCPSASEATLKDMGNRSLYQIITNSIKFEPKAKFLGRMHNSWDVLYGKIASRVNSMLRYLGNFPHSSQVVILAQKTSRACKVELHPSF